MDLEKLQNIAAECTMCDLCKGRNKPVFSRGNPQGLILVCGMCPGPDENKEGYPFVEHAPAGSVLNSLLIDAFGDVNIAYITNLVKCFVQPGISLTKEWMTRCLPYFVVQMSLIKPKVVITLGKDVANFLLNNDEKMGAMRGKIYTYMNAKLISTYHPSFIARTGGIKSRHFINVIKDFKKSLEFIQG